MHLHGSGILHGSISPVGELKDQMNPHADARRVQNNILITRDGQACLGDFAIAGTFTWISYEFYQQETLRYMAPECIPDGVKHPSRGSDVYSLAMASFSVCASFGNHPTAQYNRPVAIRSSRGYCHITKVTKLT